GPAVRAVDHPDDVHHDGGGPGGRVPGAPAAQRAAAAGPVAASAAGPHDRLLPARPVRAVCPAVAGDPAWRRPRAGPARSAESLGYGPELATGVSPVRAPAAGASD